MMVYFAIGLGFYLGVSLCRLDSFKDATVPAILRGFILGLLLWPIGIALLIILDYEKSESTSSDKEQP